MCTNIQIILVILFSLYQLSLVLCYRRLHKHDDKSRREYIVINRFLPGSAVEPSNNNVRKHLSPRYPMESIDKNKLHDHKPDHKMTIVVSASRNNVKLNKKIEPVVISKDTEKPKREVDIVRERIVTQKAITLSEPTLEDETYDDENNKLDLEEDPWKGVISRQNLPEIRIQSPTKVYSENDDMEKENDFYNIEQKERLQKSKENTGLESNDQNQDIEGRNATSSKPTDGPLALRSLQKIEALRTYMFGTDNPQYQTKVQEADTCTEQCNSPRCAVKCAGRKGSAACSARSCNSTTDGADSGAICVGTQCYAMCFKENCTAACHGYKCFGSCEGRRCQTASRGHMSKTNCLQDNCFTATLGDDSVAECNGQECEAHCIGSMCLSKCNGPKCITSCGGDNCIARCQGKDCRELKSKETNQEVTVNDFNNYNDDKKTNKKYNLGYRIGFKISDDIADYFRDTLSQLRLGELSSVPNLTSLLNIVDLYNSNNL